MKIIFFGTPQFAADVLNYLLEQNTNIVAVITKPDRPQGRSANSVPTPVKCVAQAHVPSLPVHQPEIVSVPEFAPVLANYQADLFVIVAYGEIIKQHLLDMPRLGCINLHASLLPKYRGAAPIQRCLIAGEKETGITIMHMVKKMDAGDIIATTKIPISPNTTFGELEHEMCQLGAQTLLKVIHDFERGIINRIPQDHSQATLAPKIEHDDCEIHWNLPAQVIHNLVRGVTPHPGAWCWVLVRGQKKRFKIITTRVVADKSGAPGEILSSNHEGLVIGCGEQAVRILELQLEGKKAMTAEELLRGLTKDHLRF
jgi:methionyl-tRNA formyltransferase